MTQKIAFITGITGQDGYYLTRFLLQKNYKVHGLCRRVSTDNNTARIQDLLDDMAITLHSGDVTDPLALVRILQSVRPDEIYNLAAQSHVGLSFENPYLTSQIDAIGALNMLEAVRCAGLTQHVKFYQAGSSEMYGDGAPAPQDEHTPFRPVSPYGAAKVFAHNLVCTYRQAHGLFACNGILFNHESPWRGESFVTRKITLAAAKIVHGKQDILRLGNLDAQRDWGHAQDYTEAMWAMLQQSTPDDYVIATGRTTRVRDFATTAFAAAGIDLTWHGHDQQETGIDPKTGLTRIVVDPLLYRPAEIHALQGNPAKAVARLGWDPDRTPLHDLVQDMVKADLARTRA